MKSKELVSPCAHMRLWAISSVAVEKCTVTVVVHVAIIFELNGSTSILLWKVLKSTRPLSCLLYSTVVKLGPCGKIYSSAFEVSITGVLAQCAA